MAHEHGEADHEGRESTHVPVVALAPHVCGAAHGKDKEARANHLAAYCRPKIRAPARKDLRVERRDGAANLCKEHGRER